MTLKVLDHLELVCARTKEPLQKPTSCQGLPLAPDDSDEERNEVNGSPQTGARAILAEEHDFGPEFAC